MLLLTDKLVLCCAVLCCAVLCCADYWLESRRQRRTSVVPQVYFDSYVASSMACILTSLAELTDKLEHVHAGHALLTR